MRKLKAWFVLSRPAFLLVGIFPYILGTLLAHRIYGQFDPGIFVLGLLGVVLVMLATYYSGEYWDHIEDALSARGMKTPFAGGSGIIQKQILPRRAALHASLVAILLALATGLVLQFGYRTGTLTLAFGILGLFAGFFYSARPIRWVRTGFGELLIALCYGWLPVAVGFYLQTVTISRIVHWIAIPIGLTIFNVILINEYLDYEADQAAGKRNLLVRMTRERCAFIYAAAGLAAVLFFYISMKMGTPMRALWLYIPISFLSVFLALMVLMRRWQDTATLARMCAATIIVNLGTTASYIIAYA